MSVCIIKSTSILSASPLSAVSGPGELLGSKDMERKQATWKLCAQIPWRGGGGGEQGADNNNSMRSLWQRGTHGPGGAWRRPIGLPGCHRDQMIIYGQKCNLQARGQALGCN